MLVLALALALALALSLALALALALALVVLFQVLAVGALWCHLHQPWAGSSWRVPGPTSEEGFDRLARDKAGSDYLKLPLTRWSC